MEVGCAAETSGYALELLEELLVGGEPAGREDHVRRVDLDVLAAAQGHDADHRSALGVVGQQPMHGASGSTA